MKRLESLIFGMYGCQATGGGRFTPFTRNSSCELNDHLFEELTIRQTDASYAEFTGMQKHRPFPSGSVTANSRSPQF